VSKGCEALILGIESSFNDSGAAVVKGNGEILSNKIMTFSEKYHSEHAPILSKEHHQRSLPFAVEQAL
jgi:tRNA A37 threonylcarbamoyltransferase TsaD